MANKEDLRVRRTKAALADAFIKLLEQKTFDEITINELCDKADVRRATFYKHYADKNSFLKAYIYGLRDRFDTLIWKSSKPTATVDYYVSYARSVIEFINEHETAINNILDSSLFPSALSIIMEQNYSDTCDRLRASVAAGMQLNASVEVTAGVCAGGVSSTIYVWLKNGKPLSADELADEVGAIVSAAISKK